MRKICEPKATIQISPRTQIAFDDVQAAEVRLAALAKPIPCPFVYANGKRCNGHIVRVEAYKADIEWVLQDDDTWEFSYWPRSHFHLYCSKKNNHAGSKRSDSEQMKFWDDELPAELREQMKLCAFLK